MFLVVSTDKCFSCICVFFNCKTAGIEEKRNRQPIRIQTHLKDKYFLLFEFEDGITFVIFIVRWWWGALVRLSSQRFHVALPCIYIYT